MSDFDTDVFIVGGGPAGLAAAIAARKRGLRTIVADAAEPPIDKCCGEGLMPDGVAALRQLGVSIPSNSGRFAGISFFDGGCVAQGRFAHGKGFGIRRTVLEQVLLARALELGVECRFHARVLGIGGYCVRLDRETVRTRWIIGADGSRSHVRQWADLSDGVDLSRTRYGFRRHFQIESPPEYVEVHWRDGFQVFVTPVNHCEVGLAMTTGDPSMRLDQALAQLPELRRRLGSPVSTLRGAVTGNVSVPAVYNGNVALVGDASGTVDSITGEGIRLALRQSLHLASAINDGDLAAYGRAHAELVWQPRTMARLLLWLARHPTPRHAAVRMLRLYPTAFQALLSTQTGAPPFLSAAARKGVL